MFPSGLFKPGRFLFAGILFAAVSGTASAQTPFWQQPAQPPATAPGVPLTPQRPATTTTAPSQGTTTQRQTAAAQPSAVIARVDGHAITQADFDRVSIPYFERLRGQFGNGFEGDLVKIANHNVFDELLRREMLRVEVKRQNIVATPAEIDSMIAKDPFFWKTGTFDVAQFNNYKSNPQSNYAAMLPEFQQLAAMDKLDKKLRAQLTPSNAAVREEWSRRNDQVRLSVLAIAPRDISLEPESNEEDWAATYRATPEKFMRKTRIRIRYTRLPLPPEGDSTRAKAETKALARARDIADSLAHKTLPDTASRLMDTGLFEALSSPIPTIGYAPELSAAMARADSDSTYRRIAPITMRDAVFVGVITERQGPHVPPMREVLGDVKRQADIEKRRMAAEADRRAYYDGHLDRWKTQRISVSRLVLQLGAVRPKTPSSREIEKWYGSFGHAMLGIRDSMQALPPLDNAMRTRVRTEMERQSLPEQAQAMTDQLVIALRNERDVRAAARGTPAKPETLSLVRDFSQDSLFFGGVIDTLFMNATANRGKVRDFHGIGGRSIVWRIDAVDTTFTPNYDLARSRVEREFLEEERRKDEADARAYFEKNRASFKTPLRYGLDLVSIPIPPTDSIRVTDAQIQKFYTANRDRYRQEEQVKARHILLSTQEGNDDARAKKRADSLLTTIKGGADFVDLAKRFSQEPGASTSGGDLGWFGRGRMVKEFETAAFALQPGKTSEVVKTQFGYHIIRVEDRKPAGVRTLNDVREEIRGQLKVAEADSSAVRAARALRRKLAAGGDAKALASRYGGVTSAAPFAANEAIPSAGFVPMLNADLPKLAVGSWARDPYRTGSGYIVVKLRQKVAPHAAEFDEAKAQAIDDMKTEKKKKLLLEKADAIRKSLAAGASLDSLAAPYGGLKDTGPIGASAEFLPIIGFAPRATQRAFKMNVGDRSDSLLTVNGGVAWYRLDEHKRADPATFAAQKDQIEQEMLLKALGEWTEKKKKTVKIDILRADLREPRPSPYKTVTFGGGGG